MRLGAIVVTLWLGLGVGVAAGGPSSTGSGLPPDYGQTSWPSLHRDSRNSAYAPFVAARRHRITWRALQGAAVLPAPVIGPEGHLYVTTGRGAGFSHLHALDAEGNLLWESDPQQSGADLDSGAAVSAPLVDQAGDVYVADADQVWAFHADGSLKWTVPTPGAMPFASLVLTQQGFVGGATLGGTMAFFRRTDGAQAVLPFELPGGSGPAGAPVPPGLWTGGLLDSNIVATVYHVFLGRVFEVTNTPAVAPETGRIFVVAAGSTPSSGALYGLDIVGGAITVGFTATLGGGSGTSPSLAPDGGQVYVVDGSGVLTATDASTGALLWSAAVGSSATSVTVGADGTIFTGGKRIIALDPTNGQVKWSQGYDAVAASLLPQLPASPPYFTTGAPTARTNSVISASATRLHAALALGYEYTEPTTGATLLQPRVNLLMSVDPATGTLLFATVAPDSNDGLISIAAGGGLYSAQAAMLSSIFYYGLNQALPRYLRMPGPPSGGLTAYEPESFSETAVDGWSWVRSLGAQSLAYLENGEGGIAKAGSALQTGLNQLAATDEVVAESSARGEVTSTAAQNARIKGGSAYVQLSTARALLSLSPAPNNAQLGAAVLLIVGADSALAAATSAIAP